MTEIVNMQLAHAHNNHSYENASCTRSSVGSDSTYSPHSAALAADRCKTVVNWIYIGCISERAREGKQEKKSEHWSLAPPRLQSEGQLG